MKELLDLKKRIGFSDPRTEEPGASLACADYMSRVAGEFGSKGRMPMPGTGAVSSRKRHPGWPAR